MTLVHVKGEREGLVQRPGGDRLLLGRDEEADVIFDEDVVSTHHAEIVVEGDRVMLVDLDSTNGTYLNGDQVKGQRPLSDGDVIRFGRKGPELRVELDRHGAKPKPVRAPAGEVGLGAHGGAAVATRPRPAIANPAVGQTGMREAIDAVAISNRKLKLTIAVMAAAFVAFFVYDRWDRRRDRLQTAEREKHAFEAFVAQTEERSAQTEEALARALAEAREREAQLQRDLKLARRSTETDAGHIREIQSALGELQIEIKDIRTRTERFKEIAKEAERSLVLIFSTVEGRDRSGQLKPISGFGTGFIVSSEGHIVTNKHVIQPWKYSETSQHMFKEGIVIDPDTVRIAVWPAGELFAVPGTRQLDFSRAYSTDRRTLEIARTTRDRWMHINVTDESGKTQSLRVHANDKSDDLAVLKATGGPFRPLKLREPTARRPEKLDPVMVLGFPRGPQILEKGRAEPSPSLGEIRKYEETITITAPLIKGNSGGPLFDMEGQVIGVCSRVASETETLGMAIGIEHARRLLRGVR